MATGVVFNGRDNVVGLQLTDAGAAVDLTNMTKVVIGVAGEVLDSVETPALFDLSAVAVGVIGLKFGAAGIEAGTWPIRVVVFDALNPNGITWVHEDESITREIRVIAEDS